MVRSSVFTKPNSVISQDQILRDKFYPQIRENNEKKAKMNPRRSSDKLFLSHFAHFYIFCIQRIRGESFYV